jgi:uncharacterized protein (TIGR02646 family)
MRFINKTLSPQELEEWKLQRLDAGQSLTYNDLSGNPQSILKTKLLDEQKHLCCYCQQVITLQNSTIEHFLPQALFKRHEVDYLNLHLVCKCSRGLKGIDTYCDVKKANELIVNLILHPLCESFFRYSKDGEMLPNSFEFKNYEDFLKNSNKLNLKNQSILHLIQVLNLNANDLVSKRKKSINDLLSKMNSLFDTKLKIENILIILMEK